MMTKFLRLLAVLATPIAMAGGAQADTEPYDQYAGQDDNPPSLILYSGPEYSGEVREIYDPIHALPNLQFNDRARSIAVLSGQWEVCQHSDFTGRCVFLRYDVPDLAWYGLAGEISSVRPVYEYTDAEHGLMFVRDDNGYIRYVDDERYGHDTYSYGYGASTSIQVYHYGYSPEYRQYGYYDPRLGYDPYGFGWTNYSRPYYSSTHYRRERPPLRGHYGARDASVTLYTDSFDRGASLGINRGVRDLSRYRFNDNVSSIQIRSGKWEVCEHANFQGRCQIVDASVDRLNGLRLNDNISSIRPVGSTGHDRWDRHERDGRRDGPRDGRRGDRTRRDTPQAGFTPGTGDSARRAPPKPGRLPPGIRNMQAQQAAAKSAAPSTRTITPQPVRRPGERVVERRVDPALSGGPDTRREDRIQRRMRDTREPDFARAERRALERRAAGRRMDTPDRRAVPSRVTPRTPDVRKTPVRPAPTRVAPTRDTRPPAMRRMERPVTRAPEARRPITRAPAARAPDVRAPAARQPVKTPQAAPPPRVSRPVQAAPRPASSPPRATPKRDTRPPGLRRMDRRPGQQQD
ncbi:beta/gamma crystallin domain-containing protein [Hyphomonas adhaerens MHS-3]|uniref:Beta/gamma crystallin domain-containing protein n=1 Tax=Hyphomonas adhaerens MHS-3 TaxID=1280949 RepID=A0A069E8W4_9PROT|nr:beta/gamma crystallin-related protein [Hyphomonas adhaerens]KCZ84836.1 beta/gamma crystallin domain-containing protein [Hyphomonas adhaerens MHS-3]